MKELAVPRLGAFLEGERIRFRIWAPEHRQATVMLFQGYQRAGVIAMEPEPGGFFTATAPADGPRLYKIGVDDAGPFPDPWSRAQPLGVHGPSEVVDERFAWTDAGWKGVALEDLIVYELHVGTATREGTFEALVPRLADLVALGVTAIELMPVASFPGRRNWGYDGVSLFAPAAIYGGPTGLRRLVDAAHAAGLGVLLDVVYNHLGPDGNYLGAFSRGYFSERHHTPWGAGLDLSRPPVRELLRANAEMWIRSYHLDGLRLDATDAIADASVPHVIVEIAARARAAGEGRRVLVIAEDDRNEASLLRPVEQGGYGLDAVWTGDFHHAVRRMVTGDHEGYFADFDGSVGELGRALERGWIFEGQPSRRTGGPRGTPAGEVAPMRFVHFLQNHDQVGNRAMGDRLGAAGAGVFRALSALLLLSPYTPLLFMGQEWNASTPFQFFTDHHPELGRLVREGRRREYAAFAAFAGVEVPDPQDEATFLRSKLDPEERARPDHAGVLALYRELLSLRRTHPALAGARDRGSFRVSTMGDTGVVLERRGDGRRVLVVCNLGGTLEHALDSGEGWQVLLTTEEERFGSVAPISPQSALAGSVLRLAGAVTVALEARA